MKPRESVLEKSKRPEEITHLYFSLEATSPPLDMVMQIPEKKISSLRILPVRLIVIK